MSRGAAEAAAAGAAGFAVWATAAAGIKPGIAASRSAAERSLWRISSIVGLLLLAVDFTAEEYESTQDASSNLYTPRSQIGQVDFSMLESYPEVVMSKLHLHHGHTHHHAESVSAAVSCMAK